MNLARSLYDENGMLPLSERKVRGFIAKAIAGQMAIIYVIGEPDDLYGCIGLEIGQTVYSDEWLVIEHFNFVAPNHRNPPGAAKALIEQAKATAVTLGIPLLTGIVSNHRTEGKVRLYERMLPYAGAFFLYNGVTGGHGDGRQNPN